MDVGEALKLSRESLGLTQTDVSKAIGINRATYEAYEKSLITPELETMELMAELLGLDLVGFSDEPMNNTLIKISAPTAEYKTNIKEDKEDLTSEERMVLKYLEALDEKTRKNFLNEIKDKYIDIVSENLKKNGK